MSNVAGTISASNDRGLAPSLAARRLLVAALNLASWSGLAWVMARLVGSAGWSVPGGLILVLFLASALFWSIFEQAGSTLNLFADRSTDNRIFGISFPSSYFQSLNSIFIYALAPAFAWLWVRLGDRDLSVVTKFSIGLFGAGGGFLIMMFAAIAAGPSGKVSPMWLTACYLLHTIGELCLSPVGLSAMTKLAPKGIAGMTMGVFFLSISVGNFLGGRLASFYESIPLDKLFGYVGAFGIAMGLIMLAVSRPVTRLMGGAK